MRPRIGPAPRRRGALAVVCLLVLLAGCSALTGGQSPDETNETQTGTGPAELETLPADHLETLRGTGNVTVNRTTVLETEGRSVTQHRRYEIDFDSGAAFTRSEPLAGSATERYRTANGSVYERTGPEGDPFYRGPEETDPVNATALVELSPPARTNQSVYEEAGERTVDGTTATVYVADGIQAAPQSLRADESTELQSFRAVLVVAPSGYVLNETVRAAATEGGQELTLTEVKRYERVGETTVTPPEWLPEARAEARKPDLDDVVTRTYSVEGPNGTVELAVTAEKGELDNAATVGPRRSENPVYRNELLDSVRVGSIARYYFLLETVERVQIRVHYDDDAIADANESQLRLVVRNDTTGFWDVLNTSVDERTDVVSTTISDPAALDKYQGETVLALRWRAFLEKLDRQPRNG